MTEGPPKISERGNDCFPQFRHFIVKSPIVCTGPDARRTKFIAAVHMSKAGLVQVFWTPVRESPRHWLPLYRKGPSCTEWRGEDVFAGARGFKCPLSVRCWAARSI